MTITITVDDTQAALLDQMGSSIPGYTDSTTYLTAALNACAAQCVRQALSTQMASLPVDQLGPVVTATATAVSSKPATIKP